MKRILAIGRVKSGNDLWKAGAYLGDWYLGDDDKYVKLLKPFRNKRARLVIELMEDK